MTEIFPAKCLIRMFNMSFVCTITMLYLNVFVFTHYEMWSGNKWKPIDLKYVPKKKQKSKNKIALVFQQKASIEIYFWLLKSFLTKHEVLKSGSH